MVAPVPVCPSPKSHAHAVTVPSGSLEAVPSKLAARNVADEVNEATGGWLGGGACTVTAFVTVPVAPWLSVTVSLTG